MVSPSEDGGKLVWILGGSDNEVGKQKALKRPAHCFGEERSVPYGEYVALLG